MKMVKHELCWVKISIFCICSALLSIVGFAEPLLQVELGALSSADIASLYRLSSTGAKVASVKAWAKSKSSLSHEIVIVNRETQANVVLRNLCREASKVRVTDLLLAELKNSELGNASAFDCIYVQKDQNGSCVGVDLVSCASPNTITIPRLRYATAKGVFLAKDTERVLRTIKLNVPTPILPQGVSKSAYDAAKENMRRIALENALYTYEYVLPNGDVTTYSDYSSLKEGASSKNGMAKSSHPSGGFVVNDWQQTFADGTVVPASSAALSAILAGCKAWDDILTVTEKVYVLAGFSYDLFTDSTTIGSSFSPETYTHEGIAYPAALIDQIKGEDMHPDSLDINILYNANFNFYYGTDGNCPSSKLDFLTVVTHEMCHGLGFTSYHDRGDDHESPDGTWTTDAPSIFDTFLYCGSSRIVNQSQQMRVAAFTSDALYWDGENAKSANGNSRIKMYAPSTYVNGSSVSHWDDSVSFTTFMKWGVGNGEVHHEIDDRLIGAFKDMGWTFDSESETTPTSVKIPLPTAENTVYSGSQLTCVTYDSRLTLVSGSVAETAAGSYSATFALPSSTSSTTYTWTDGSTANQTVFWKIYACNVNDSEVSFAEIPNQAYTGATITPSVSMTFAGVKRTVGTDYTVSYANNINVGTATATVKGIGNFQGEKNLTFNIVESSTMSHTLTIPAAGGDGTVPFTLASSGYYHFAGANPDSWITSLSGSIAGTWSYAIEASDSYFTLFANSTVTLNCSADANTTGSARTWDYVITGPENHTITIQQPSQSPEPGPDPTPDPEELAFTTGGDSDWYEQTEETYDDISAWRSGVLGNNQTNWLSTTVSGNGWLSFKWVVSSENGYDWLFLKVDGEIIDGISGNWNYEWQDCTYYVRGEGQHTVAWLYCKDASGSDGDDAGFVDEVTWEVVALPDLTFPAYVSDSDWNYGNAVFASDTEDISATRLFEAGDGFKIVYGVVNNGVMAASAPFVNRVRIYDENSCVYENVSDWTSDLAAGVSKTISKYDSAAFAALPAGPYKVWAFLDANGNVEEIDNENNSASYVFAIRDSETLNNALDNDTLTLEFNKADAWYGTKGFGSDGVDCAAALLTGNSTTNDMTTTIVGPKILSFKWKVSSEEGYDWLLLLVDGDIKRQISGTGEGWQDCQVKIPSGSHTVTWRYAKDCSYYDGMDGAWVDQVTLSAAPSGSTCYGLFVGINKYSSGQGALAGCVTDAKSMKMVCADYGNWPLCNMTVVTDYAATLARYKQEIASLASIAESGDTVLIYNSGHGGQYGSTKKDTCICTSDSYYSDTDFAADIGKFKSGVKLIVMLDTCCSAGMFKSASTISTDKASNANSVFLQSFIANVSTAIDARVKLNTSKGAGSSTIGSDEIGWIAAAEYDVTSQDLMGAGLFTGFMVVDSGVLAGNADANADGQITFKEIYDHAKGLSSSYGFQQVAQSANEDVLASVSLNDFSVSLQTALNNDNLSFDAVGLSFYVYADNKTYTDANTPTWIGQNLTDGCCARTVVLPYSFEKCYSPAKMTTTVSGEGTMSFKWRVSSASGYDVLCVYIDGECYDSISGEQSWADVSIKISGEGDHEITWAYDKYSWDAKGDDCGWVSDVAWTGSGESPTPSSDFEYELVGSNAIITDYVGVGGDVCIPETLGGYTVVGIGENAFSWREDLTSVQIPNCVKDVGSYAYAGCENLASIQISTSTTNIGDCAFLACGSMRSVDIPTSVTVIGAFAFAECTNLTSVLIPANVATLGAGAFKACSKLTSFEVDAANANYSSSQGVLYSKDMLTLICYPGGRFGAFVIPSGVQSVAEVAFAGCEGLSSLEIASSVSSIGLDAFAWCTALASVKIPESVLSIGGGAFYGCDALATIYVDAGDTDRVRELLTNSGLDCKDIEFIESDPEEDDHEFPDDWVVPYNKENWLTITAVVYDRKVGEYLEHPEAHLAAFDAADDCCGVVQIEDIDDGAYMFFLSVGFNGASSAVTLRYWDPVRGIVDVAENVAVSTDVGDVGDYLTPVVYEVGNVTVEITLNEGFTWISIPVVPENDSFDAVFKGVSFNTGDRIQTSGSSVQYSAKGTWLPASRKVMPGAMYVVKKTTPGIETITVSGAEVEPLISVVSGYNWIGCPGAESVDVSNLVHSAGFVAGDKIQAPGASAQYLEKSKNWTKGVKALQPGIGYKLKVGNAGEITIKD